MKLFITDKNNELCHVWKCRYDCACISTLTKAITDVQWNEWYLQEGKRLEDCKWSDWDPDWFVSWCTPHQKTPGKRMKV